MSLISTAATAEMEDPTGFATLPERDGRPMQLSTPKPFPSAGEYVSAGLKRIYPDAAFPHMTLGNTDTCGWAHLRREFPHNWYVDERHTGIGFLSRDEAHILYNTALAFPGQRALEIGCWMGWSACHLALGGVELDVIDPMLDHEIVGPSVAESLDRAGVRDRVSLIGGYSPGKVEEIARAEKRRWSLIFIDGDHEGRAPVDDAIVCDRYAESDALILLHDLASPDAAAALDWLQDNGWNTMVYHTMQIMGVAWRGSARPVKHLLDPRVRSSLPAHLRRHPVSGGSVRLAERTPARPPVRAVATLNVTTPGGRKALTLEVDPALPLHQQMLEPFAAGQLYAPAVANMIAAALLPGSTFVEIGTGVGYFSILAALRVGEGGRVVAVADHPRHVGALAGNLRRNEMNSVSLAPRACSGAAGEVAEETLALVEGLIGGSGAEAPRAVMIEDGSCGASAAELLAAVIRRWQTPILILRRDDPAREPADMAVAAGYSLRSTVRIGPDQWDLFTSLQ